MQGFRVSDSGASQQWMVVQASGRTVDIEPMTPSQELRTTAPGLVFIGLENLPEADEPAGAVRQAAARATRS